MEQMVVQILILFALGASAPLCAGFPVYDYEPSSLREALAASVAKVNSQSLSPYLFRAFRGSVRRVSVLDDDSLSMDIEFSIRETTCRRDSGGDPATCDFQRRYYVPAARCRSSVHMSAERVQGVWVRCSWASSSESSSSEEGIFGRLLGSSKWRNNYQFDLELTERLYILFLSLEITRRISAPGNRSFRNQWPRLEQYGQGPHECTQTTAV
ncbi:secreted phosphoprotein 24 [Talpa occidentalis]|uniref:secreted phosphoprotein 24 n=1 Tax=Talpa occidentalis TaxID=50954 RepID=UPI001890844D|nr:secreted phosphoprotein 24 [Talpa occidentalis]